MKIKCILLTCFSLCFLSSKTFNFNKILNKTTFNVVSAITTGLFAGYITHPIGVDEACSNQAWDEYWKGKATRNIEREIYEPIISKNVLCCAIERL
jgi:hypothetical protein